jgi:HEAT repeats
MEGTGKGAWLPGWVGSLRFVLLALLAVSAAFTLGALPTLHRGIAQGRWPATVLWVPPALLALFVLLFAGYRFALVRAGRYPAGRAFLQVGLIGLVSAVIAGIATAPPPEPESERGPVPLEHALASGDPTVRALAAEVVRHRPRAEGLRHVPRLIHLVEDPSPAVRREARASLAALAGRDVGGEGRGASARWREAFPDLAAHGP